MAKCRLLTSVVALTASGKTDSFPDDESLPWATLALAVYVPVLPLSDAKPLASKLIDVRGKRCGGLEACVCDLNRAVAHMSRAHRPLPAAARGCGVRLRVCLRFLDTTLVLRGDGRLDRRLNDLDARDVGLLRRNVDAFNVDRGGLDAHKRLFAQFTHIDIRN